MGRSPSALYQGNWFRLALQLRGSVVFSILPRTLVCAGFGVLISWLHQLGWPVSVPVLVAFVPNVVLGLLLVFRTNTAYDRFWEGRKHWGSLVNTVRNLARQIWVAVGEKDDEDRMHKARVLRLLVAFAVAMKLHLRHQRPNQELEPLLSAQQFAKLREMNNPPLEVALWIGDYLQLQHYRGLINTYQLAAMHVLLNGMVDTLGACERILKTPIPPAYAIHLKQLLLLYCLSLPFQMVETLSWLTGPIVGIFSFTLLGIEEIGVEIENPFGFDPNDLPLDAICQTMLRNIEDLLTVTPESCRFTHFTSRFSQAD
jgi:putative membrane protein